MNSIIEAQIELKEQQALEKERCKNPVYFYEHYVTINGEKPSFYQIEEMRCFEKFKSDTINQILEGSWKGYKSNWKRYKP